MILLGRKPGERIVIDNDIIVHVLKCPDGQLKLGIEAPKEVSIIRGELLNSDIGPLSTAL